MADKPPDTAPLRRQPKRIRSEEQKLKKKGYDLARAKSRVNIGTGFQRWRNLRELKCIKTDEDLALFLLDNFDQNSLSPGVALGFQSFIPAAPGLTASPVKNEDELNHNNSDEVVVKLECLLQLFQKCLVCCCECSISTERDGWFFYVTQKCQQCHYSREWASHPTDQIISDSAENHEVIEDTVIPTPNSDTESAEEGVGDVVTVIYEGSDDSMDNQRNASPENKDNPSLCVMMKPVEDTGNDDEEDDDGDEDEEEEDEDTDDDDDDNDDDDDDDDDDDWVMKSKALWSLRSATAAPSSEPSEANREVELEPPMVWCKNCNSDFTRSCYKLRHKRMYGCLLCGTKDGALSDTSTGNQESSTSRNNLEIPKVPTTTNANSQESNESNNKEFCFANTDNSSSNNAEHKSVNFQDLAVCLDDLEGFQKHARQCHGVKQFREPCPDCGKFITLRNKVSGGPPHICEHKARPNSCLVCGKGFASQKGLLSHMTWVHLRGTPYIVRCLYCLKRFTFRKQKIEHEKIHQKEELKYSCPHCPLRFADLYSRSAHRKTHRVFSTFTCKVCSRTFKQACKLERHMAVHTGLKPYICKVCDRSFNQSGHLKSHMRVHTGEKPFKCQECGQCFNHNVSLKNHVQRKHKPKAKEWTSGEEEDRGE